MANSWLRLWHDMPTDPKFRTVSRISGQQISLVISVYVTLLVDASRNVTRGHITVTHEDMASQLDVTEAEIKLIFDAMEGRLIEKSYLSGWEKRQPKREDSGDSETGAKSSAQRKKEQREREKLDQENNNKNEDGTQCHEESRNVTLDKDKDKDKDLKTNVISVAKDECPHQSIISIYHEVLPQCPKIRDWTPARQTQLRARWNEEPRRQNLDYWRQLFEYIASCDFLVGKSGNVPFFADLEWITKSKNFTKIREEKYANR